MTSQINFQTLKTNHNSMAKEPEDYDTENTEIMNTSGYSFESNSMDKNESDISDTERTRTYNSIKEFNRKSSVILNYINKKESVRSQHSIVLPSTYMPRNPSINTSLQNNFNEYMSNASDISQIERLSISNEIITPSSVYSYPNNYNSVSLDNKSELDDSSVIVEINDKEEPIGTEKDTGMLKEKENNDFVVERRINEANGQRRNIQSNDNRISIATSGDITYVDTNQPHSPYDNTLGSDGKNSSNKIQDKEEADIGNKECKISFEEDDEEDNTCAICLIETRKPTDIENITSNKDNSNETVISPSKDDIDNYECKLHCMHKFHYSCIAQWLERHQNCPICRMEIKHYEIEAIEKRFDISIKIKEEPIQLIQPRYNTTFDFDTEITEELVSEYMSNHLPWLKLKPYFYTRFIFYYISFFLLTVAGIIISIFSFIQNPMFYASYAIVIILIGSFIIISIQSYQSIKEKRFTKYAIVKPASSSVFYGTVGAIFILLFANLNNFIKFKNNPITTEEIYQYVVAAFFAIMMILSCTEARHCYLMFKEDNRRTVDAEVYRQNQEIINRTRQEESREREEFERNFSHLND